ncbi:McrC family protein [Natronorubrum thiooxidans]|uniref:5-methylcytosine-specific restriction enzyme subunit McrC n=1 Tax=Natronorubrum thiooxidans TaxID=308853 RepID=A0A1N7GUG4_9EURY|nr:hypothetical protein [Natronorubrum thiooxidans]SIS16231.1 5-methylcytosine-specific restriction enzyme subunit McrC [Natronorubrum thiooxidans]
MSNFVQKDSGGIYDISLREHSETKPLKLSSRDLQTLRTEFNVSSPRIDVVHTSSQKVKLKSRQYVGVISFPDGPTIEILPKVEGANLLYLLRYAYGVESNTYEQRTLIAEGPNFIEAIATLFETELERVFRQGLAKGYHTVSTSERYLRGRLNIHQQLQQHPSTTTKFECTYDELTHDIPLNRALLYAASLLTPYLTDSTLARRLGRYEQRLQKRVTLTPITVQQVKTLDVSRLTAHYKDILRLVEMVIMNSFVEDFRSGHNMAFSLLVNMNTIFEKVVENAFTDIVSDLTEYRALIQEQTGSLLASGSYDVDIKPDIALRDADQNIQFVGDAKWKTGKPQNQDFYQIAAYQNTHMCPGALIYPDRLVSKEGGCELKNGLETKIIELPTGRNSETYSEFKRLVKQQLWEAIEKSLSENIPASGKDQI